MLSRQLENLRLQFEKQDFNLASSIHISGTDHTPMKKDDPQDTPWQKNVLPVGDLPVSHGESEYFRR